MISPTERIWFHALATATQSQWSQLNKLKTRAGSWEAAAKLFQELSGTSVPDPEPLSETLKKLGVNMTFPQDKNYPALLKEIPLPPHAIYYRGTLPTGVNLAMVGTRKASTSGLTHARSLASEMARHGVCIVSGLALGIDTHAHTGALEAGGTTVAVVATGLDTVYPRCNSTLAKRIVERGGCLISEYPPGSPALPYRFLERNRIVSGLSRATLVVEAPEHSGALATARFALEQNRDVYAMPGGAEHKNYAGCHNLIRSGAQLATRAEHILEGLGIAPKINEETVTRCDIPDTPEEKQILAIIDKSANPVDIDTIATACALDVHVVTQAITNLLLSHAITETDYGFARHNTHHR